MCVTSADSRKGFPVSNTRGWYALYQRHREIQRPLYTVGCSQHGQEGKRCSLSSSYLTHIDCLTSARNCVSLGHQRRGVLAWGVARLMGGGSGLTSPLRSVLSQCTVRYRPSFAVQGIYPGVQLHAHGEVGTGIITLCIVWYR